MNTGFKIHVHRQALHSPEPKKWYVHLDGWGPDPQAFTEYSCTVPTRSRVDLEKGCGCAQAWVEGSVSVDQVTFSEDGNVIFIGSGAKEAYEATLGRP